MDFIEAIALAGGELYRHLLDLVFPPRCIVCRCPGTWLCSGCVSGLPRIKGPVCRRCGVPTQKRDLCTRCRHAPLRIEKIRSAFLHEGPVRVAIHRLKYRNARALAKPLGEYMATWWRVRSPEAGMVVVPVPLHPSRLRKRGYNQAALLAQEFGRQAGLPVREGLLSRVRHTASQMKLDAEARQRNVSEAFSSPGNAAAGIRVLLVDDVCTTGATLEACADALRSAGALDVWALTLARAP
jgi:ComF family protein